MSRQKYIMVRCTDDEYERIQKTAKKLSMSAAAFIRQIVSEHLPVSIDEKIKAAISKKEKENEK